MRIYLSLNEIWVFCAFHFLLYLWSRSCNNGSLPFYFLMDIPSVWKLVNSWMVINILSLQIGRTCIIKYFTKNIFKKYLDASEWVKKNVKMHCCKEKHWLDLWFKMMDILQLQFYFDTAKKQISKYVLNPYT